MSTSPGQLAATVRAKQKPFLDLTRLGRPEYLLCVTGPVLFVVLFFIPWFDATGYSTIDGHSGMATAWESYSAPLRYFLLWCSVGAFLLPWIVARGHELSWPHGEVTAIHGIAGVGLLLLNGLGFRPGEPAGSIQLEPGYAIGLLAMLAILVAGAWRAHLSAPSPRKPPGA